MPGYLEFAVLLRAGEALCVFVDLESPAWRILAAGDFEELFLQSMDGHRSQRCCQMKGKRTSFLDAVVLELMCCDPAMMGARSLFYDPVLRVLP